MYDKSFDSKRALRYSIHLLARQDYSVFKLSQKLKSKKYDISIINQCIQKLEALGYLNEENYTRLKIRSLAKRGYGKRYILQRCEMEKLSLDENLIDEVFFQEKLDEDLILQAQIEKKTRHLNPSSLSPEESKKTREKIMRSLMGRGFSYDKIKRFLTL